MVAEVQCGEVLLGASRAGGWPSWAIGVREGWIVAWRLLQVAASRCWEALVVDDM